MSFWSLLGIGPTTDKTAIRHAYAEKTKTCHPEEDPEGFDALHKAFDAAMQYARRNAGRAAALKEEKALPRPAAEAPPAGEGRGFAARRARQAARAAEQEAFEEYQRGQSRARGAEPSLGQGEQESGQQFDFAPAQAAPESGSAAPEPPKAAAPPPTPEEAAWRNEPPPLEPPAGQPAAEGPAAPGQAGPQPQPAPQGRQAQNGPPRWRSYARCVGLGAAVLLLTRSAPAALAALAAACVVTALLHKKG